VVVFRHVNSGRLSVVNRPFSGFKLLAERDIRSLVSKDTFLSNFRSVAEIADRLIKIRQDD